ncbi:uncharacterized protein LTR77_003197 [Saxophila tyrrhenica]|uniref:Ran guanine nucleotide release factor n=1 Tax=Saxophila tyrrhenica TaxID=1690608 RepID=A0AAV9PKB6_9PEZI|nr:hypothetical protein LTR77_003197 [Saxophila tyrrhenica]
MAGTTQYRNVDLFGGAIAASLPSTYADVSEIRQVPDNQEVYLDTNGFASIVVDILERVEKPDTEALQFHLSDIVDEDASETKVWTTAEAHLANLPQGTPAYTLFATSPPGEKQKGRPNEPDFVGILLTMVRLEKQKTDILLAINVPHIAGQYDPAAIDPAQGKQGALLEAAVEHRTKLIETFEVKDWDLFVQE